MQTGDTAVRRKYQLLVIIFALVLLAFRPALAAYRPQAVSLSGEWKFVPAEPLTDLVEKRSGSFDPPKYNPTITEVIPEEVRGNPESHLPDKSDWQTITVPSAWEQVAGIDYNGAGWYRRTVHIPENWLTGESRIRIEFDGVATAAGVWLNGKWLGSNVGDYVRWQLEATPAAQPGENDLLIYVDELPGHITQGFLSVVAPHHGGIWQEARMYYTGPLTIKTDGIHVNPNPQTGEVRISAQIGGNLRQNLPPPELKIGRFNPVRPDTIIRPYHWPNESYHYRYNSQTGEMTVSLQLPDFERWDPDHPVQYLVEWQIPPLTSERDREYSDRVFQKFAFRTIQIEGSQVLLNGQPLNIRSVLNWGYYPRRVSPSPPPEVVRKEFQYIKQVGFNAETICLMVMPDYFYDLADEMGILIWEEYPTWHNEFTEDQLATYRRVYPAFFRRDRHHPSIILRSMTVEAGVKNQKVMAEIVETARKMTDTPVQDNSSWFWLSNADLTDWYGEDNYWNNDRWARHILIDLPQKLDKMPEKPYIIGESMAGSVWPDIEGLSRVKVDRPLPNGLTGTDEPHRREKQPYWFPRTFSSCQKIERQLRARYNSILPDTEDIIENYLIPQSYEYAKLFRKFQIELMYADPRYAGYTVFLLRDLPGIRSGLIDDLGHRRWSAEAWDWFDGNITPQVTAAQVKKRSGDSIIDLAPELLQWNPEWGIQPRQNTPVNFLKGGYSDLTEIFRQWPNAGEIREEQITELEGNQMVAATVLTYSLVDFMERGGKVVLFTSRWPGALGSEQNMYWGDAVFAPPVGPWSKSETDRILKLQLFDLTHTKSEAIAVQKLGITENVDPLLRLFGMHGLEEVVISDQVFATRVGNGLLVASSLDHTATAGQWVLGKLIEWAHQWRPKRKAAFPVTRISPQKLKEMAVARVNTIVMLDRHWRFKLDPDQQGEKLGWAAPGLEVSDWKPIRVGQLWESQGYSYDGMAWYRRPLNIPEEWKNRKVVLVAEGVDDAYRLWINGKNAGMHGSFTEHAKTVYRTKTETQITPYLKFGRENVMALQVVDVFGGGGISRPIYLRIE